MKKWFAASLFFQSVHESVPPSEGLWEEVIVLIYADEESHARTRADAIGKQREHTYSGDTPMKHVVRWSFVKTERISEIDFQFPTDEGELFSRFLRAEEAKSILTPFDE